MLHVQPVAHNDAALLKPGVADLPKQLYGCLQMSFMQQRAAWDSGHAEARAHLHISADRSTGISALAAFH